MAGISLLSYWAPVIKTLNDAGYRVVVPDQIGFGKSSKPLADLHFDTLARNTIALLDHLGVAKTDIVAHSFGGMLGVRIARAYPDRIAHLVLTAPIGLEDYRLYVPPTPTEKILENEDKFTADGYRKQLETNYALKLPPEQVTPFIDARFNIKGSAEYPRWLRAFVSSAQLIYREPVVHEIPLITQPTLFRDGRRRSQLAGSSECAGGAARENGAERRTRQGARDEDGVWAGPR